jgi:hypothetical protein
MSLALLVVGYLLAVPPLPFLRRIVRERLFLFACVESLGAALITLGWLMRGRTIAVVINGGWFLIWTAIWTVSMWRAQREHA